MKQEQWRRAEAIFHAALDQPADTRAAFLDHECGGDAELRRRVGVLLSHDAQADSFLEAPVGAACGTVPERASSHLAPTLAAGQLLGPYLIEGHIGAGGMGQVYKARDTRLDRVVAIKILVPDGDGDPGQAAGLPISDNARARFEREAKTIAGLNHPHICTLYDVSQRGGATFLVMEHVEGETLATRLLKGPLPGDEALQVAIEIADALAAAHRHGVIHRDLKPTNIMVGPDGHVKVVDFGLAKHVGFRFDRQRGASTVVTRANDQDVTQHGVIVGTVPYMSPEQVAGETLDVRSDVFSFGAVLYELLTGRSPFRRHSTLSTLTAIVQETPVPARQVRPDVPAALDQIIARCLEKSRELRYASAVELHDALLACRSPLGSRGVRTLVPRSRLAIAALALVTMSLAAVSGAWLWSSRVHWARTVALPRVVQLLDEGRGCSAFRLLGQAERYLRGDPEVARLRRNHMRKVTFRTNPPGADVYVRDYLDGTGGLREDYLGQTPLQHVFIPSGQLRYRISKPGWKSAEGYTASAVTGDESEVALDLDAERGGFVGMVRVPAGSPIEQFWLDRYEVTNARFKRFVSSGGYTTSGLAGFKDRTGHPGPATWASGSYPAGTDEYPVGGVSWYEAAAYCRAEGKSLPTVHHWRRAAVQGIFTAILQSSNIGGRQGPARVGSHPGVGPFGTYDTAGNVREWCLNAVAGGDERYALGGAWTDPNYLLYLPDARLPSDRSPENGFRCARYERAPAASLEGPVSPLVFGGRPPRAIPVNDEIYAVYKAFHTYDHRPLDPRIEATSDESPFWRQERVSFRAAYGNERVAAYLFLPRNAKPPFQAVITAPGVYAFDIRSSARLEVQWFDFIIRSGRAVVHPVFKGTYERGVGGTYADLIAQRGLWRELALQWYKDLGRTIDYLDSRADIDHGKVAYQGISFGAAHGPRMMALEPRLKAGLLFWGGLVYLAPDEVDPTHFAPRCTTPTLMVNGRSDPLFPDVMSQAPLFRLLGAPDGDKHRTIVENAGHVAINEQVVREALDWLDKYLGPAARR